MTHEFPNYVIQLEMFSYWNTSKFLFFINILPPPLSLAPLNAALTLNTLPSLQVYYYVIVYIMDAHHHHLFMIILPAMHHGIIVSKGIRVSPPSSGIGKWAMEDKFDYIILFSLVMKLPVVIEWWDAFIEMICAFTDQGHLLFFHLLSVITIR